MTVPDAVQSATDSLLSKRRARGLRNLVVDYFECSPGKSVLYVVSPEVEAERRKNLLDALFSATVAAGARVELAYASQWKRFSRARLHGHDRVVFLNRTRAQHSAALERYVASTREPMIFQVFDFSPELLDTACQVTRAELTELNEAVIAAIMQAGPLRAICDGGTDLVIEVPPELGWTSAFGRGDVSYVAVLPAGEINTYSPRVSGRFVVGGAVNTNFGWVGSPVIPSGTVAVELREGRVQRFSCTSPVVSMQLDMFFSLPNSDRVGEIGIGTNTGVRQFVPFVSHINERRPGLHLGFGTPVAVDGSAGYDCPLHLDFMMPAARLYAGERLLFRDGAFAEIPLVPSNGTSYVRNYVDTK